MIGSDKFNTQSTLHGMTADDYLGELKDTLTKLHPRIQNNDAVRSLCMSLLTLVSTHTDELSGVPLNEVEIAQIVAHIEGIGAGVSDIQADMLGTEDTGRAELFGTYLKQLSVYRDYFLREKTRLVAIFSTPNREPA